MQYTAYIDHSLGSDKLRGYTGSKEIAIESPKHCFQFHFSEITGLIERINCEYNYKLVVNGATFPSKVVSSFIFYEQLNRKPKKLREPDLVLENVSNFEKAKYRPKFWRDNSVIKLTAEEERIIQTFEEEKCFWYLL